MRLLRLRRRRDVAGSSGQTLVEFALVIPLFILTVVSVFEFSFLFATYLSASFASRDGVQVAAEAGSTPGSDCAVIQRISRDIAAPADPNRIQSIRIFWSDAAGNMKDGAENVWLYGGSTPCTSIDGSTFTVPYTQTSNTYPEGDRCNVNLGIGCKPRHTGVDTIGITITYRYSWITPFPKLVPGSGTGPTIVQSNMMRIEPIR